METRRARRKRRTGTPAREKVAFWVGLGFWTMAGALALDGRVDAWFVFLPMGMGLCRLVYIPFVVSFLAAIVTGAPRGAVLGYAAGHLAFLGISAATEFGAAAGARGILERLGAVPYVCLANVPVVAMHCLVVWLGGRFFTGLRDARRRLPVAAARVAFILVVVVGYLAGVWLPACVGDPARVKGGGLHQFVRLVRAGADDGSVGLDLERTPTHGLVCRVELARRGIVHRVRYFIGPGGARAVAEALSSSYLAREFWIATASGDGWGIVWLTDRRQPCSDEELEAVRTLVGSFAPDPSARGEFRGELESFLACSSMAQAAWGDSFVARFLRVATLPILVFFGAMISILPPSGVWIGVSAGVVSFLLILFGLWFAGWGAAVARPARGWGLLRRHLGRSVVSFAGMVGLILSPALVSGSGLAGFPVRLWRDVLVFASGGLQRVQVCLLGALVAAAVLGLSFTRAASMDRAARWRRVCAIGSCLGTTVATVMVWTAARPLSHGGKSLPVWLLGVLLAVPAATDVAGRMVRRNELDYRSDPAPVKFVSCYSRVVRERHTAIIGWSFLAAGGVLPLGVGLRDPSVALAPLFVLVFVCFATGLVADVFSMRFGEPSLAEDVPPGTMPFGAGDALSAAGGAAAFVILLGAVGAALAHHAPGPPVLVEAAAALGRSFGSALMGLVGAACLACLLEIGRRAGGKRARQVLLYIVETLESMPAVVLAWVVVALGGGSFPVSAGVAAGLFPRLCRIAERVLLPWDCRPRWADLGGPVITALFAGVGGGIMLSSGLEFALGVYDAGPAGVGSLAALAASGAKPGVVFAVCAGLLLLLALSLATAAEGFSRRLAVEARKLVRPSG